jgi:response regulator of citrate/malate metabolism
MRDPVILYIEDSIFYQQMLRSLVPFNIEMYFSPNGRDGLIKSLTNLPDIIFLDVMLPDARGPELIQTLKNYLPNVYIVMVTSDNTSQTVSEARSNGANAYVVKPFSEATIKKHLTLWHSDFSHLPRQRPTIQTQEKLKKVSSSSTLQTNPSSNSGAEEYKLWLTSNLNSTYPFVFFEVVKTSTLHEGTTKECYVLSAFAINFEGHITCLGAWTELAMSDTPSRYLIKETLKTLHSRGLVDIYIIIIDPILLAQRNEFKSQFSLSKIIPRVFEPIETENQDLTQYEKDIKSITLTLSQSTLEQASKLMSSFPLQPNERKAPYIKSLEQCEEGFIFGDPIKKIIFGCAWIFVLKNHVQKVLKIHSPINDVEQIQKIYVELFNKKDINALFSDLKQLKGAMFTKESYKEAMFIFSQIMLDRFPKDEYFQ